MDYVTRNLTARFRSLLRTFPCVLIVGPRQSGESTLVRNELPRWRHLDLERPSDLALLDADPEGFFNENPRQVVVDEAQRLPALFPLLRHVIDRSEQKGRFVLLGSASPQLMHGVSETLAGRVGILELTPFLSTELSGSSHGKHRWFFGGYPPVHALRGFDARVDWLDNYVTTFLKETYRRWV